MRSKLGKGIIAPLITGVAGAALYSKFKSPIKEIVEGKKSAAEKEPNRAEIVTKNCVAATIETLINKPLLERLIQFHIL